MYKKHGTNQKALEMKQLKFSDEMAIAIEECRKTQTRRVIDPQPYIDGVGNWVWNGVNFGQNHKPHIQSMASSLPWRVLGTNKTGYHPQYGIVGEVNNGVRITHIRVERLHEISEDDAKAEGVESIEEFKTIWQSFYEGNKDKDWEIDPYVWVIEFEKNTENK